MQFHAFTHDHQIVGDYMRIFFIKCTDGEVQNGSEKGSAEI